MKKYLYNFIPIQQFHFLQNLADDIMIGNRLQEQVGFLEGNPEYGMVGGDYQIIDES